MEREVELTDYLGQLGLLWLLILLRTMGFFFLAPMFNAPSFPVLMRILLSFLLANVVYAFYIPSATLQILDGADFAANAIQEIILGMLLGFIVSLIFTVFHVAGELIGYQMGFSVVNVFDPSTKSQVSIVGQMLSTVAMLVFLGTGQHLELLRLWLASYELLPPGSWMIERMELTTFIDVFGSLFAIGMRIALPLICFLILTDLTLGILARVMPQMNVFFIGIPLKIALGLLTLTLVTTELGSNIGRTKDIFINHCGSLIGELGADIPADADLEIMRELNPPQGRR